MMNKKEKSDLTGRKSAIVGLVICFAVLIAAVGAYTFNGYQNRVEQQLAEAEQQVRELTEENSTQTNSDDINDEKEEEKEPPQELRDEEEEIGQETASPGENTSAVWFDENSVLEWPASGAVVMGYSMDRTVFFQTLEQYQYNPAMMISGQAGETICASAAGIVTEVSENAKTGKTVTMDMGNGYSAVYGQLDNICAVQGAYIPAGGEIGTLAEPTRYFTAEGPNLYFQILKDGSPVDPANYME